MNAIKKIFKDNLGLIISSAVIFVALMVIYSDTLDGTKSFYGANDKVSARNVKEAVSKSGDYPYWFPWMMGGVPSVHSAQNISDYYPPNYIMKTFHSIGVPWFWNYIFHFLFAGIGMYLLCSRLKLNSFASTLSGLGFAITPYMTGMLVHGHGSQVMTLCYMPWIFYAYIKLKDKPSIKRLALLSLFLALQLLRGHVQMAYYTWMMLGILILIDIIYQFVIKKDNKVKWLFYTALGLLLGFMSSLSLYIPMLSYTPFSTRSSGDGQGAGLDYVTEYSFSFGEIATFFIPSYYGFEGSAYWGTMTFTAFPHYMSVIMVVFAIYGAIRYRWSIFKVFSMLCIAFFLTLSFGKNFIGFYTFFYEYLPFFSKLRNPAYLLIVVQFCTMILAGMGIGMVFRDIENRKIILPIYSIVMFCFLSFGFFLSDPGSGPEEEFIKKFSAPIDKYRSERLAVYKEEKQKDILDARIKKKELDIEGVKAPSIAEFEEFIGNKYNSRVEELDEALSPYYKEAELKAKERGILAKPLIISMINVELRTMLVLIFLTFLVIVLLYDFQPFFLKFKIINYTLLICIGLLVFFDFHFINRRITNPENSKYLLSDDSSSKYEEFYKSLNVDLPKKAIIQSRNDYLDTTVVKQLLSKIDAREVFRVIDRDGGSRSNKWTRYHIEDVNGYHPAKLKNFKEFLDDNGSVKESSYILDMLNVKYEISQGVMLPRLQSEDRVYFAKEIQVGDGDKESRFKSLYLSDKKPSDILFITSNILNLSSRTFAVEDSDVVESFDNSNPNELIVKVRTSGPQFLAISEVFYPNGWKATIDNEETNIYEVNDLIRGVYIDKKGPHTIRMWFDPSDLKWGRAFSYVGFLVILTLLFFRRLQNLVIQKRIK